MNKKYITYFIQGIIILLVIPLLIDSFKINLLSNELNYISFLSDLLLSLFGIISIPNYIMGTQNDTNANIKR